MSGGRAVTNAELNVIFFSNNSSEKQLLHA